MADEIELVNEFEATDEQGNAVGIEEFVKVTIVKSRAGVSRIPGMRFLRTHNGLTVDRVSKGHYMVHEQFKETAVTSSDPNAP